MTDRRKLVTATLFGVAIAVVKGPFQWPITDYLIIVEAPILGLSYLLLGRGGATYTGLVNGILQSFIKVAFFPWDLVFGVSYGVLVDIFGSITNARSSERTSVKRMTLALGLASTIAGLGISYIVLTLGINLGPAVSGLSFTDLINIVYIPIIVWGILSGAVGGFIASRVWDKNLRPRFGSIQT